MWFYRIIIILFSFFFSYSSAMALNSNQNNNQANPVNNNANTVDLTFEAFQLFNGWFGRIIGGLLILYLSALVYREWRKVLKRRGCCRRDSGHKHAKHLRQSVASAMRNFYPSSPSGASSASLSSSAASLSSAAAPEDNSVFGVSADDDDRKNGPASASPPPSPASAIYRASEEEEPMGTSVSDGGLQQPAVLLGASDCSGDCAAVPNASASAGDQVPGGLALEEDINNDSTIAYVQPDSDIVPAAAAPGSRCSCCRSGPCCPLYIRILFVVLVIAGIAYAYQWAMAIPTTVGAVLWGEYDAAYNIYWLINSHKTIVSIVCSLFAVARLMFPELFTRGCCVGGDNRN